MKDDFRLFKTNKSLLDLIFSKILERRTFLSFKNKQELIRLLPKNVKKNKQKISKQKIILTLELLEIRSKWINFNLLE